jgi:hypothetical protein
MDIPSVSPATVQPLAARFIRQTRCSTSTRLQRIGSATHFRGADGADRIHRSGPLRDQHIHCPNLAAVSSRVGAWPSADPLYSTAPHISAGPLPWGPVARAFTSRLAVLVEKGPTLVKAIQHTGRDLQAALLRQALSKPDHRTGRSSDTILGRITSVGRDRAGRRPFGSRALAPSPRSRRPLGRMLIEELTAGAEVRFDLLRALDPTLVCNSLCKVQHRCARKAGTATYVPWRSRLRWPRRNMLVEEGSTDCAVALQASRKPETLPGCNSPQACVSSAPWIHPPSALTSHTSGWTTDRQGGGSSELQRLSRL